MGINKTIDVANNSSFMFISHPVMDSYMYGAEITTVKKNNELLFILQKGDGSNNEPIVKDHESAICLQVLRAYREEAEGLEISDIHFYAPFGNFWQHITFNEFDSKKISKSWPECDSGEALGHPVIEIMTFSEPRTLYITDDFSSHPFYYWWNAVEAASQVTDKYEDKIIMSLRGYKATEEPAYKYIYAIDKKLVIERLNTTCEPKDIVYKTPIIKAKGIKGWVMYVVYYDKS